MRILHATTDYSAYSHGGTEVYIDALWDALAKTGEDQKVLLLSLEVSCTDGKKVYLLDGFPEADRNRMRDSFLVLIRQWRPDCIFLHTNYRHESVIAEFAKEEGIPVYYFVHTQWGVGCIDRERLNEKRPVCYAPLNPYRCLWCYCRLKFGDVFFKNLRHYAIRIGMESLRKLRLKTDSRFNSIRKRCDQVKRALSAMTGFVIFSEKQHQHLLRCGVPDRKIILIPQGITKSEYRLYQDNQKKIRSGIAKFGYVGRISDEKGVDILIRGAAMLPEGLPFELHVYGMPEKDTEYSRQIRRMAASRKQIIFHTAVSHREMLDVYGDLDAVVIPSLWFETGPYTLLEALYSGCRVISSGNIGQISLLRKYGTVLKQNTPEEWKNALGTAVSMIPEWRQHEQKIAAEDIRLMDDVARKLLERVRADGAHV